MISFVSRTHVFLSFYTMKFKQIPFSNLPIFHRASYAKKIHRKIVIIFLSISLNLCFVCLKELSHLDDSFEYPQHRFWLRNKKKSVTHSYLISVFIRCQERPSLEISARTVGQT